MVVDIACNEVAGSIVEYERRGSERSRLALFQTREPCGVSESALTKLLDGLVAAEGVWANLKAHPDGLKMTLFKHSRPSAGIFAGAICQAVRQGDQALYSQQAGRGA
jgi:hypothetical protein